MSRHDVSVPLRMSNVGVRRIGDSPSASTKDREMDVPTGKSASHTKLVAESDLYVSADGSLSGTSAGEIWRAYGGVPPVQAILVFVHITATVGTIVKEGVSCANVPGSGQMVKNRRIEMKGVWGVK